MTSFQAQLFLLMNNVTVPKPKRKFVRIELTPELQTALAAVKKLYFEPDFPTTITVDWLLNNALIHWPKLEATVMAQRKYIHAEDIEDLDGYYARKLEARWKR